MLLIFELLIYPFPLTSSHSLQVAPPKVSLTSTLQMMTANIDYDTHLGRIAIGRIVSGSIKKGQSVSICSSLEPGKVVGT